MKHGEQVRDTVCRLIERIVWDVGLVAGAHPGQIKYGAFPVSTIGRVDFAAWKHDVMEVPVFVAEHFPYPHKPLARIDEIWQWLKLRCPDTALYLLVPAEAQPALELALGWADEPDWLEAVRVISYTLSDGDVVLGPVMQWCRHHGRFEPPGDCPTSGE